MTFHVLGRRQSRLLSLPVELIFKIFEHTEIHEFAPLAQTCRYMYHLASELIDTRKNLQTLGKYYPCSPNVNTFYRRGQGGPVTIWADVHNVLKTNPKLCKFTRAIVLKRERRPFRDLLPTDLDYNSELDPIVRIQRLSNSNLICKFIQNSGVLQRANLTIPCFQGLIYVEDDPEGRRQNWVWGWLLLLVMCHNVEYLLIPRKGSKALVDVMGQIILITYYQSPAELGGKSYGIWSNLTEILLAPSNPRMRRIRDENIRFGEMPPTASCLAVEDVGILTMLPSLKKLHIVNMVSQPNSAARIHGFHHLTASFASNLEDLEVHMACVEAEHAAIFFLPLTKLRRLTWHHKDLRGDAHTIPNLFSSRGFMMAVRHLKHTLEYISLVVPCMSPRRSPHGAFCSLQEFDNLKELRIDASLLFPTAAGVGPQAAPISMSNLLPRNIREVWIWRSVTSYVEFEWEYLFDALAWQKRAGNFPDLKILSFLSDMRWDSQVFGRDTNIPKVGVLPERLIKSGIQCRFNFGDSLENTSVCCHDWIENQAFKVSEFVVNQDNIPDP